MERRRREFLAVLGATSVTTLAGCGSTAENGEGEETPTESRDGPETSPDRTDTPADDAGTPTITPTAMLTPTPSSPPARTPTATPLSSAGESAPESTTKLGATDGDSGDNFGSAVAVSGDGITAIIGAVSDEDPNGPGSGSAYVFSEAGEAWSQEAKLVPDDGEEDDEFGWSVAISGEGTTAIVGAVGDDSAHVFGRASGRWSQQATLAADDGEVGDAFGNAVAVSNEGTTAVVGAVRNEDPNGELAGSTYVFEQSGGDWTQQARLAADDGNERDHFGRAVAVSGDGTAAIIGADTDDDPNGGGSAYVFEQSSGGWEQQAKLAADDGDETDHFGRAVAMSNDGTTAVIGADFDRDPNGGLAGSAYVFEQDGGGWTQQAKLAAGDGDRSDRFGWSVAVSGDGTTAIVGAYGDEDPNGGLAGSVYVFEQNDSGWDQQAKLAADDGETGDAFGWSVTVSDDGTTVCISARDDGDPNGPGAGSAYVFE